MPLLRAGFTIAAVIPIALASDTASIAVMEFVDNGIMLLVPGAMEAGVGDVLFWGALSVALVVAGAFALPLNRWLIARGKGHSVVHETGVHGGPSPKLVGAIAAVAAVFGTVVLAGELVSSDDAGMGHGGDMAAEQSQGGHGEAADGHAQTATPDPVRGLTASAGGLTLELDNPRLAPGERGELRFQVVDEDRVAIRDFAVEHEKRLHLILARRDLTGFQHLHPRMSADGTWSAPVTVLEPGEYRAFADFKHDAENRTLARDFTVGLSFHVTRGGEDVAVEDYLGAKGHLVALRAGDLAYLHTHPTGDGHGEAIGFETEFPSEGSYRLFLQFKHGGEVHTAAFTRESGPMSGGQ